MAECEKMMQLCEASIDQALSQEEQEALERHLAECPACAAYLADLRFLAAALGEPPELPKGLHERVMDSIQEEAHRTTIVQTHRPHRRMPVFTTLAVAAACVALVLSGATDGLMNVHFGASGSGAENGSPKVAASDSASPAEAETGGAATKQQQEATADEPPATITTSDAGADTGAPAGAPEPFSADAGTPEPFSMRSAETPEEPSNAQNSAAEEDGNATAPETAAYDKASGRSAEAAGRSGQVLPQVGTFLSNVMNDEIFAACYLVEGGSELPNLGQEQQRDAAFAYYVTDNNLAQLETLLDALEKAGCTVNLYEEDGVLFNETAKRVIFIVRLE